MRINILPPYVFNRISAGEVVEKPASIVKELVENSIDAKATTIIVEIEDGGKKRISVSDNGCGIEKDDLRSAFLPHATSKLKEASDLDKIETLGFRGEALASISSVCHTFLSSKTQDGQVGYCIEVNGGVIGEVNEIARSEGTTIEVRDLFYNTPARAKFLRKSKLEEGEITHIIQKFMLANPNISFLYVVDGKQIYNTTSCELSDVIYTIYGKEVYENIIPINFQQDGLKLEGVIISPKLSKSNRTQQTLFVNGRYVENYLISTAIQGVYECFLMKGKFPIYVLNLIIDPESIDVNVHPTKKEVKFDNTNRIFGFVRRAVEDALEKANHIGSFYEENEKDFLTESESKDPFNKSGFNHIPVFDLDKVGTNEGVSYKKRDLGDQSENLLQKSFADFEKRKQEQYPEIRLGKGDEEIVEKKEVVIETEIKQEEKAEDKLDFFKQFKSQNNVPENKIGGPYFFDQIVKTPKQDLSTQEKLLQSKLEELKFIGTMFNTYIIVELGESVYFIDQHAAHERTLFDKLSKQVDENNIAKQKLLVPYTFRVDSAENEYLDKNIEALISLGFEIKEDRPNEYSINAVPLILSNISLKNFVENILKEDAYISGKSSDILKDKLAQTACKHAIKGGDVLGKDQLYYIIEQMKKGVLLCPHGRPIVIELTKKEIEKMFKRIV